MVYIEKSIYGLMQTRIYYGAVWQKIRTGPQHLVQLSHIKLFFPHIFYMYSAETETAVNLYVQ
jgi:hypothetical protein